MYIVDDHHTGEISKHETQDEAMEYCQEQEVLYYSHAMNYLIENDCSLTRSLGLASDLGYDLASLGSETLATIHYQDQLINSIQEAT